MERTNGLMRFIDADDRQFLARLEKTDPEGLPEFLKENSDQMIADPRPFAAFMRLKLREKGILQQAVFLAADISENYGYKLLEQEKHTVSRDMILRLCLASRFDLNETCKALILYGMAPLYERIPRDIVFITAIRSGVYDIHRVNSLLKECGQKPFLKEI